MNSFFPSPREGAMRISKALNCTGEESQELLACFSEADVDDLVLVPLALGVSKLLAAA